VTDFYIGQIFQFGGNFAIRNTAMCNGQLMSITQNTALFSILGTTYGGNGTTNFALPDLRGRRMIHQGQGPGLSPYSLGEQSGVENTTLLTTNMPAHTHTMTASMSASGLQPLASTPAPAAGSVLGHSTDTSNNPTQAKPAIYCPAGTATPIALGGLNVAAGISGGSQPFSVLNPYLAITQLIVLFGIFPARN
jgi:microcystin-dependent protein